MDRYLVISTDCHAGLPPGGYREYLDPQYRERFDAALQLQLNRAKESRKTMLVEFMLAPGLQCFGLFGPHLRVEGQELVLGIANQDVRVAHVVLQVTAHKADDLTSAEVAMPLSQLGDSLDSEGQQRERILVALRVHGHLIEHHIELISVRQASEFIEE